LFDHKGTEKWGYTLFLGHKQTIFKFNTLSLKERCFFFCEQLDKMKAHDGFERLMRDGGRTLIHRLAKDVRSKSWFYILGVAMVILTALSALLFSSVKLPVSDIILILMHKLSGGKMASGVSDNMETIIWEIRFPRVLLAFGVGGALAISGAAFQGLLRNPLADPYTLGVSSGAALGAVLVIFFHINMFGFFTLPIFAILGGLAALVLVFWLTRLSKRRSAIETLVLAGIIISAFIGSVISLLIALSGEELRGILYWLFGSVAMRGWPYVGLLVPFLAAGVLLLFIHHRELNALAFGEEAAHHLGVDVKRKRTMILIGASLLSGAAVAVSGTIGFVGLVIPHLVRLLVGPDHKHVLPLSVLVGGSFLMVADMIARTVIAPQELPVGVITALVGAPVFAFLLLRANGRKGLSS
jgi:iron complex transport system permease protein